MFRQWILALLIIVPSLTETDTAPFRPDSMPTEVASGYFKDKGLEVITSLDLSSFGITYLHPGAFDGLHELRTIYLNDNNLRSIDPDLFQHNPLLMRVRLDSNPHLGVGEYATFLNSTSILSVSAMHCNFTSGAAKVLLASPRNRKYKLHGNNICEDIPEELSDEVQCLNRNIKTNTKATTTIASTTDSLTSSEIKPNNTGTTQSTNAGKYEEIEFYKRIIFDQRITIYVLFIVIIILFVFGTIIYFLRRNSEEPHITAAQNERLI